MFRTIAIALAATTAIAAPLAAQQAKPTVDPKFVAQLREALRQNPEIIFEAASIGQQKQRDAQLAEQNSKVANLRPALLAAKPFGPVIGNPAAKNTVVELLDYQCPFCKRAHTLVDKIAKEDTNVRFIILMRPVLGPESETMARFALAANMQGKFAATHDAMYEIFGNHETKPTDENLRAVAQKAGLNFEKAKLDMTSDAVMKELARHNSVAEQMGVNGTPFFLTQGTVIPGAPQSEQQLREAIAAK
jgi:protein-disulfide isomerase